MKETGIIFTTESVRAILDGRKSQTRRVIKPCSSATVIGDNGKVEHPDWVYTLAKCPYGQVGDRLWVKETWTAAYTPQVEASIVYRGGGKAKTVSLVGRELPKTIETRWQPSIFMPRWASRITLEITEVRVERLQDIRADDVKAEGSSWDFYSLWDSLNAKRGYSWSSNPWVWVISFATGVRLK